MKVKTVNIIFDFETQKHVFIERYSLLPQSQKVSVLMPTFNRGYIISRAICSVLNQKYQNWELIIVDDGSEDDTRELVEEFIQLDSRVHYFYSPKNEFQTQTLNLCLEKASGDFITYLDTDCTMDPWFILLMVNYLIENQKEFGYCVQSRHLSLSNEINQSFYFKEFSRSELEYSGFIDMNTIIHSKRLVEFYGGFDINLHAYVDWFIALKYTKVTTPIFIPFILSRYFTGCKDRITNQDAHLKDYQKIRDLIKDGTI